MPNSTNPTFTTSPMTSGFNESLSSSKISKPPIWFWVASIIGLFWFLMDLSAFFMRVFMTEEGMQARPDNQQLFYI